jgi:hypothetical protein
MFPDSCDFSENRRAGFAAPVAPGPGRKNGGQAKNRQIFKFIGS